MTEVLQRLPIASHVQFKVLPLSPNLNLALPQLYHWLYAQTNLFNICPPSKLYWSLRYLCPSCQDCLGPMSCFCCDWPLLLEWPPVVCFHDSVSNNS